ncbi:hypothetical protein E6O75_ATG07697 [Venturia nashicola]|uniref:Uncharacterized protein n=1 Tax=Venturia nashicola TaxID=86259 RepID=A0A4Z1NVX7_9PEZI|nr:hypothetical protein E6O75_ATG07697 [Venturia nashicola]
MDKTVDFIYVCSHRLSLQGQDIPHWIMLEHRNGLNLQNDRWVGMWYDNGNVMIDDICLACKEMIQIWEQKRNAERIVAHLERTRKEISDGECCRKRIVGKCG